MLANHVRLAMVAIGLDNLSRIEDIVLETTETDLTCPTLQVITANKSFTLPAFGRFPTQKSVRLPFLP